MEKKSNEEILILAAAELEDESIDIHHNKFWQQVFCCRKIGSNGNIVY